MGDAHARLQRPRGGGGPLSDAIEGERQARAPRQPIRDAATLVIVDARGDGPLVLAGRRAGGHVFMANKLVFPGGRVDAADRRFSASHTLPPQILERLSRGVGKRFSVRHAVALALAAIRETFEETGVMIGRRGGAFRSDLPIWREFAAEGVQPSPECLVPFARAITPAGQVRRFDTRFFVVDAGMIARQVPFDERPTDEFDRVEWMGLDQMLSEDLAPITRQIVGELSSRIDEGTVFSAETPMPCYRRGPKGFSRTLL